MWKACQWLATGRWFFPCPPVSSTNKTEHHDITEILLKVALKTIKQILWPRTYQSFMLCEVTNANIIAFHLTWLGIEPQWPMQYQSSSLTITPNKWRHMRGISKLSRPATRVRDLNNHIMYLDREYEDIGFFI